MNESDLKKLSASMLATIISKRSKVQQKYAYYEAEQRIQDLGISMPAKLKLIEAGLGWASTAVDTMADRLSFDAFENDRLGVNELYSIADETEAVDQAKLDAFIAGCSFVSIVDDDSIQEKRFMAFNALEATGILNTKTGLLKYGLAITHFNRDEKFVNEYHSKPLYFARDWVLFAEGWTAIFENRQLVQIIRNNTGRTRMQLIAHRPSSKQPFGRSLISKECRLIIQGALRTVRRSEISAEFYSMPQRYLLGVDENFEKDESMDLAIGKILAIEKGEDGESPDVGQWTQQSMSPHSDHLKMFAQQFSSKTKLPLRALGFTTDNPTSAESYEAQNEDLRLYVERRSEEFGSAIKKLSITLRLIKSDSNVVTPEMRALNPHWRPIFKVEVGKTGDAVGKIVEVLPAFKQSNRLYYMLGMSVKEAERMIAEQDQSNDIASIMTGVKV